MRWTIAAAALALTGCAGGESAPPKGPTVAGDVIRFSAGPCFGICPSYSVTVEPTGSAVLVPERNTAVPGETRFTVTIAQYRRLRDMFAPYRPETGTGKRIAQGENCEQAATDMPGYEIVWSRPGVEKTELDFYSGCVDARYAGLRQAVAAVPRTLDIEAMLKPRTD